MRTHIIIAYPAISCTRKKKKDRDAETKLHNWKFSRIKVESNRAVDLGLFVTSMEFFCNGRFLWQ